MIKKADQLKNWVENRQGKIPCECGCGGTIEAKTRHYPWGLPLYIKGHNRRKRRYCGNCKTRIWKPIKLRSGVRYYYCCNDCKKEHQAKLKHAEMMKIYKTTAKKNSFNNKANYIDGRSKCKWQKKYLQYVHNHYGMSSKMLPESFRLTCIEFLKAKEALNECKK